MMDNIKDAVEKVTKKVKTEVSKATQDNAVIKIVKDIIKTNEEKICKTTANTKEEITKSKQVIAKDAIKSTDTFQDAIQSTGKKTSVNIKTNVKQIKHDSKQKVVQTCNDLHKITIKVSVKEYKIAHLKLQNNISNCIRFI